MLVYSEGIFQSELRATLSIIHANYSVVYPQSSPFTDIISIQPGETGKTAYFQVNP